MLDHYGTLGVREEASQDEVKAAYRKLAKKWHPDRNHGDKAAEDRFKEISAAYETIGDADRRERYDRSRAGRPPGGGRAMPAGGTGERSPRASHAYQADAREGASVRIDLQAAFHGTLAETQAEGIRRCRACDGSGAVVAGYLACPACGGIQGFLRKMFLAPGRPPCGRCSGTGVVAQIAACAGCRGHGVSLARERLSVRVPPGASDGDVVTTALSDGTRVGVRIRVSRKPGVEREGCDLAVVRRLTADRMAKGTSLTVATIEGGKVRIKVPPGIRDGSVLRVRGKGMPGPTGRGDLIVRVTASVGGRTRAT
jgi:molecular chaperone DnaJ